MVPFASLISFSVIVAVHRRATLGWYMVSSGYPRPLTPVSSVFVASIYHVQW